MDLKRLEAGLSELPLIRYEFFPTDVLEFSERVRRICERECPMFGKTWACPPAVGTVGECHARILSYRRALLIATVAEVDDASNLTETLATREPHEKITRRVLELVREQTRDAMALSAQSCALCEACTYPDAPCRRPDRMFPCVESHGILVTALCERFDIAFFAGSGLVTWFSLILYNDPAEV